MRPTGLVRYVDNDNSIHLPKVVMEMLGISAGTPMELFINNGDELVLKRYDIGNGNIGATQTAEKVLEAAQKVVAVVKETFESDEVTSNARKMDEMD